MFRMYPQTDLRFILSVLHAAKQKYEGHGQWFVLPEQIGP